MVFFLDAFVEWGAVEINPVLSSFTVEELYAIVSCSPDLFLTSQKTNSEGLVLRFFRSLL